MIKNITTSEMSGNKRAYPVAHFNAYAMQLSLCGLEKESSIKHPCCNIE
jgi:hypothetical protein